MVRWPSVWWGIVGRDRGLWSGESRRSRRKRRSGRSDTTGAAWERLESRQVLSAGTLDATFGSGGKATGTLGGRFNRARDVAVQSDGKVVVVGDPVTSGIASFAVARFNTNGTLDTTFSGDGRTTVSFSFGDSFSAHGVAIQPDGKIVVVGSALNRSNSDSDFAVARLNADGSLDTSFGSGGRSTHLFDVGGNNADEARDVVIQPDGKIVVVGVAQSTATNRRFAVLRLNPSGTLDSGFGKQIFPSGTGTVDIAEGVALQADGRIVVAGSSKTSTSGGFPELAVIRLTTGGSLDTSFSSDGRATFSRSLFGADAGAEGTAVAIQADGRIVVSGRAFQASGNDDFLAVRFTTGGALDTSFNTRGFRTVAFDKGPSNDSSRADVAYDLALQADGKIVLAGSASVSAFVSDDIAVARLNPDGSSDGTFFDTSGRRTISYNTGGDDGDVAFGVAIDFTGKIVLAGLAATSAGSDAAVVRLYHNRSPQLNTSGDSFAILGVGSRQSAEMLRGVPVSDILATGAGGNPISDPDSSDLRGIAVTRADSSLGAFQYTLVANNPQESDWTDFTAAGTLSATSALLLPPTARVRFKTALVPHHAAGAGFLPLESKLDAGFEFRAWDGTVGAAGQRRSVLGYGGAVDPTSTLAFNNTTTEAVRVYFEARMFRTFNANAALNVYSLEAEFNVLKGIPGYEDRSTDAFTGFTVVLSPVPELGSAPLYRLYYGVQFNADGTEVDMGYRYLTSSLAEAQGLEQLGPADKRPQRAGAYFRELGVNAGTGILGYLLTAQSPGTHEMVQIYRTDLVNKPTRPPGTSEGGTPTSFTPQENGDHVYTTISPFERTFTGTWRVESARGFTRELSTVSRTSSLTATAAAALPDFAAVPLVPVPALSFAATAASAIPDAARAASLIAVAHGVPSGTPPLEPQSAGESGAGESPARTRPAAPVREAIGVDDFFAESSRVGDLAAL